MSAPVRVPSEVAEPDVVSEVVEDEGEAGAALRHPAGRAAEEACVDNVDVTSDNTLDSVNIISLHRYYYIKDSGYGYR